MTEQLRILKNDLATHEARLIELKDPNFGKKKSRKGGATIDSFMNVQLLIPSYVGIIKSIKAEISQLETKKKK